MLRKIGKKTSVGGALVLAVSAIFMWVEAGTSQSVDGYRFGFGRAQAAQGPSATGLGLAQSLPDFISLAKKVGPSVVNVATAQVRSSTQEGMGPFGGQDPMSQFWERFFGGQVPRGAPQRRTGIGSGFIIDRDGTILTNYHVVDSAQKISVTLADGKSYDAKVIGKDQKTDIAVIKVDAGRDLPAVSFGDSDRLEVGEWVMAIGNPFGLDHTVTSGIVSAKGRRIGAGPYDNFIQTDASINPGNSGGPLLNLRGEVVGINTAIFSQTGGNIGIGFAIPANLVKGLLPQLKDQGRVVRGFIGTTVQRITPEIADSLRLKETQGALVAEVMKGSPAERAGLKTGDVIVEFDRNPVKDSGDLPAQVARVAPGTKVQIKVWRDGKELALPLTVGEMTDDEIIAAVPHGELGMTVQPVTPELAQRMELERAEGLVITSVQGGSAAEEAGLRAGDVILQINRRPVRSVEDFSRELAAGDKEKSMLLLVRRGENNLFLALKR